MCINPCGLFNNGCYGNYGNYGMGYGGSYGMGYGGGYGMGYGGGYGLNSGYGSGYGMGYGCGYGDGISYGLDTLGTYESVFGEGFNGGAYGCENSFATPVYSPFNFGSLTQNDLNECIADEINYLDKEIAAKTSFRDLVTGSEKIGEEQKTKILEAVNKDIKSYEQHREALNGIGKKEPDASSSDDSDGTTKTEATWYTQSENADLVNQARKYSVNVEDLPAPAETTTTTTVAPTQTPQ